MTDVDGNLIGYVENLNEIDGLKNIKKNWKLLEGKFFYYELKGIDSTEDIVIKFDQSKIKNIKANNRNYEKKKHIMIKLKSY